MKNLAFKNILATFEIKQDNVNDEFVYIEGLASTFGNLDREGDIIAKGAFTNTLTKRMPKLLNQHRIEQPIGVIDMAYEAEEGLRIKARMPKANSMVRDILPLLKMGALGDFSIGFNVIDSETGQDGIRIIKEIDLWEVSIVTIPANPEARITSVKKLAVEDPEGVKDKDEKIVDTIKAESISTKREFEQMLIDTGCFTRKATVILAARFNENQRDSEKPKQRDSANEEKLLLEAVNKLKKSLTKEV